MIQRLLTEQRGMALGLAIIVVVIVGVMGAGLMTIVATDLEAVVAVNRGAQAFELAEGGHLSVQRAGGTLRYSLPSGQARELDEPGSAT